MSRTKRIPVHPIIYKLRQLRQTSKTTQQNTSRILGYSGDMICEAETGVKSPRLQWMQEWADLYGYKIVLEKKVEKST